MIRTGRTSGWQVASVTQSFFQAHLSLGVGGGAQGIGDSCHPRAGGSRRVQRELMKEDSMDRQNQGGGRVLVMS